MTSASPIRLRTFTHAAYWVGYVALLLAVLAVIEARLRTSGGPSSLSRALFLALRGGLSWYAGLQEEEARPRRTHALELERDRLRVGDRFIPISDSYRERLFARMNPLPGR